MRNVRVIFDRVTVLLELFVSSKNLAVRGSSQKSRVYCAWEWSEMPGVQCL